MTPINNNQMSEVEKKIEEILEQEMAIIPADKGFVINNMRIVQKLLTLISHERAEAESKGYKNGWEARKNSKQSKIEKSKVVEEYLQSIKDNERVK